MRHASDDGLGQTNLLQALQKNKVIQGKLSECQRSYYVQLIKDMEVYHAKEKFNRELLYSWHKETYVRQIKKNLQEYLQQNNGVRDAYYETQVRSIENIIAGQQSIVVPPSEEERRLSINAKYRQFLERNPLQSPSFKRAVQPTVAVLPQPMVIDKVEEQEADTTAESLHDTWKHIHSQSAIGRRRKTLTTLPTIHRSSTAKELRRTRTLVSASTPSFSGSSTLPNGLEPLLLNSDTLQKHTRSDLVAMRSVRRPKKNPSDMNMIFEARKRICQINKHALDVQVKQRKAGFSYNPSTDRSVTQRSEPSADSSSSNEMKKVII